MQATDSNRKEKLEQKCEKQIHVPCALHTVQQQNSSSHNANEWMGLSGNIYSTSHKILQNISQNISHIIFHNQ